MGFVVVNYYQNLIIYLIINLTQAYPEQYETFKQPTSGTSCWSLQILNHITNMSLEFNMYNITNVVQASSISFWLCF